MNTISIDWDLVMAASLMLMFIVILVHACLMQIRIEYMRSDSRQASQHQTRL